ncbi:MAG TPA: hypothetical protein VKD23_01745 [Terriglobales bacterium]|nr:hypothetical protein [Terriglobales bacterium]
MRHAGKKALSTGGNMNGSLNWEVLVTPGIPAVTSDLAPGTKQRPGSTSAILTA